MVEPLTPQVECVETTATYGRFSLEPLERGFGTTLGNALRRVLFSTLPGAAVTWIKVEGVEHEFTTVPNMKEDLTDFLLNVKALRLRSLSQHPGKLALEVQGEGEVTASDMTPSADFEVANPELHLATLDSAKAKLSVEFNVELGKGYVPAGHGDGLPIGVILVDAIFTPVRQVNYTLEPTHIEEGKIYEKLVLEVWTDGTIAPEEAVSRSAEILMDHFFLFRNLAKVAQRSAEKQLLRLSISSEQYNMPVEQMGLSVRTMNCLRRGNIATVGQLMEKTDEELMSLRSFGQKSLDEVKNKLSEMGLVPSEPAPSEAASPDSSSQNEGGDGVEEKKNEA